MVEKVSEDKKEIDEFLCAICMGLLFEPVIINCNHRFCRNCLEEYTDNYAYNTAKCPLCRQLIDFDRKKECICYEYDKNIEELIKEKFPLEYQMQKLSLENSMDNCKDFIRIRFRYGNTHRLLEKPFDSPNSPGMTIKHSFSLFIEIDDPRNAELKQEEVIDKVLFELHETFKEPKVLVLKPPFKVSRRAWGYFEVPITVYLNKGYLTSDGKSSFVLEHMISFEGDGESKFHKIKLLKVKPLLMLPISVPTVKSNKIVKKK